MKNILIFSLIVFSYAELNIAFKIKPRIIGGYKANPAQFPYYAYLENFHNKFNLKSGCGSTIIADEWLVTAAHCIQHARKVIAHFGISNLNQIAQPGHQTIVILEENFRSHPIYVDSLEWNDIALIHLPQKIMFTTYVQPARLPSKCESVENLDVITMGNGATSDFNTNISEQMHFAVMKTLPMHTCRKTFPFLLFRKSVFCAQNEKKDQSICSGDSGSPIIRASDGTFIGVTVIGHAGDCESGEPQGFTNLYSYLKWIKKHTGINVPSCRFTL